MEEERSGQERSGPWSGRSVGFASRNGPSRLARDPDAGGYGFLTVVVVQFHSGPLVSKRQRRAHGSPLFVMAAGRYRSKT